MILWYEWIFSGALFGLASMIRSIGVLYALFAALVLVALIRPGRRGFALLCIFAGISMILPAAWTLRNRINSGHTAFVYADKLRLHPRSIYTQADRKASKIGKLIKMMGGHGMEMAAWMILHDPNYDATTWWKPRPGGMFSGTTRLIRAHPILGLCVVWYDLFLAIIYWLAFSTAMLALIYFATGNRATTMLNPFLGIALASTPIIYHVILNLAFTNCYFRQRLPIMPFIFILAGRGWQTWKER